VLGASQGSASDLASCEILCELDSWAAFHATASPGTMCVPIRTWGQTACTQLTLTSLETLESLVVLLPSFFVLACVLVHETTWLDALDALIELRRDLKRQHGIATRPEIKGKHFKNGWGVFKSLGMVPRAANGPIPHTTAISG
jgi:hypothetical protein